MENMHRVPTGSPYGGGYGRQTYYYENEMTPEEIFRMMFGDFSFAGNDINLNIINNIINNSINSNH